MPAPSRFCLVVLDGGYCRRETDRNAMIRCAGADVALPAEPMGGHPLVERTDHHHV